MYPDNGKIAIIWRTSGQRGSPEEFPSTECSERFVEHNKPDQRHAKGKNLKLISFNSLSISGNIQNQRP